MRPNPPKRESLKKNATQAVFTSALMDNFVRLQQSQEEFLLWLDESEKSHPELDRYNYKKIR